jgi:hypothetical protein
LIAWAARLCLFLAVLLVAPAAQAAGHSPGAQGDARGIQNILSTHHGSGEGFVFPRDGIAPQPAIATRKKAPKLPIDLVGGDVASPAGTRISGPVRYFWSDDPQVRAFDFSPPHPWQSRAPPHVS